MNLHFEGTPKLVTPLFLTALFFYTANAEATLRSYSFTRRPTIVTLTSGTSWTVPAGVTKLSSVECWGGGGGAAGSPWGTSFGGGGGGAHSGSGAGAMGGAGGVPGGGAGSHGGNNGGTAGPGSKSGGNGQIVITYRR